MSTLSRMSAAFLLRRLTDRLLPGCCALCGGNGPGPICALCRRGPMAVAAAHHARCDRCAIRLPRTVATTCATCSLDPPAYDRTLALADYAPPLDRLLQDLKFRAHLPLAAALGDLLAQAALADAAKAQRLLAKKDGTHDIVLLPVPLSRERLAERGFNQAQEIARPLARALHLKIATGICSRIRHTEAQASLPANARQVNMRGAFAVLQRQAVAGKAIWVVDDVMTTGHTLAALAACLKRHGAAHVTNLVIARTPAR